MNIYEHILILITKHPGFAQNFKTLKTNQFWAKLAAVDSRIANHFLNSLIYVLIKNPIENAEKISV